MKCGFFILLGVLLLIALGNWAYKKYIDQPTIEAEIYFGSVLLDKKIYYKVNYSGIEFSGAYDVNQKGVQDQERGKFEIRAYKNGMNFTLELLKNGKAVKSLNFDLLSQKLKLKA